MSAFPLITSIVSSQADGIDGVAKIRLLTLSGHPCHQLLIKWDAKQ